MSIGCLKKNVRPFSCICLTKIRKLLEIKYGLIPIIERSKTLVKLRKIK